MKSVKLLSKFWKKVSSHKRLNIWFWRFYLAFTLGLTILIYNDYLKIFPDFTFKDWFYFLVGPIYPLSLILYIKRRFIWTRFWKIFFVYYLIDSVLSTLYSFTSLSKNTLMSQIYSSNVYSPSPDSEKTFCICILIILIPIILLLSPQFYVLHKLGWPKK